VAVLFLPKREHKTTVELLAVNEPYLGVTVQDLFGLLPRRLQRPCCPSLAPYRNTFRRFELEPAELSRTPCPFPAPHIFRHTHSERMVHDEMNDWMACRDWVDSKIGLCNTLRIVRGQISEMNTQDLHL
jgi:hypothetical protein